MSETATPSILGIDISKASFDVALLAGAKRPKRAKFANQYEGFEELQQWLQDQGVVKVHACLEATNQYGQGLARYLYSQGHQVSIVNPAQIKGYRQSCLSRTKNDAADARVIAQFCQERQPRLWQPAPAEIEKLQAFSRRLTALERMMTQEKNRLLLYAPGEELATDIEQHLEFLETQVQAVKARLREHIQAHESLAQA